MHIYQPTEPVMYRFTPTEDFHSPELASFYVKGGIYSVRQGDDILHNLIKNIWKPTNKVKVF